MANLWGIFKDIAAESPTLIGTVLSHTADGYSMVEMPGGGLMKAKGISVDVGKKVFVQSNEIKSEAPDLQNFEVIV